MAKCPVCECELAGMETICRECFEKQYASPASGSKGLGSLVLSALGIAGVLLLLEFRAPEITARFLHAVGMAGHALRIAFDGLAISLGIWESLKWRSAQNLLFWIVMALNLAAVVMFLIQHDARWYLPILLLFLLRKGMTAFIQRHTA